MASSADAGGWLHFTEAVATVVILLGVAGVPARKRITDAPPVKLNDPRLKARDSGFD